MHRELTRKNKLLPYDACITLLQRTLRGVLSVQGDDGYPYGMPMNHYYCADDGCLYFHCGRTAGHRLDALRRSSKVSFCTYDDGVRADGEWALEICSVIVFGQIEIVDDVETVCAIARDLCRKFTQDAAFIEGEIANHAAATLLLRLRPAHICGKRIKEA